VPPRRLPRSWLAGRLRSAAGAVQRLAVRVEPARPDPSGSTRSAPRPGEPPEHWLAVVAEHAPGLLRDLDATPAQWPPADPGRAASPAANGGYDSDDPPGEGLGRAGLDRPATVDAARAVRHRPEDGKAARRDGRAGIDRSRGYDGGARGAAGGFEYPGRPGVRAAAGSGGGDESGAGDEFRAGGDVGAAAGGGASGRRGDTRGAVGGLAAAAVPGTSALSGAPAQAGAAAGAAGELARPDESARGGRLVESGTRGGPDGVRGGAGWAADGGARPLIRPAVPQPPASGSPPPDAHPASPSSRPPDEDSRPSGGTFPPRSGSTRAGVAGDVLAVRRAALGSDGDGRGRHGRGGGSGQGDEAGLGTRPGSDAWPGMGSGQDGQPDAMSAVWQGRGIAGRAGGPVGWADPARGSATPRGGTPTWDGRPDAFDGGGALSGRGGGAGSGPWPALPDDGAWTGSDGHRAGRAAAGNGGAWTNAGAAQGPWPALPDDRPLWLVPADPLDAGHLRRLNREQAGD
jgi:hypothetical protein